jgi:hypothetical protein
LKNHAANSKEDLLIAERGNNMKKHHPRMVRQHLSQFTLLLFFFCSPRWAAGMP